VYCSLLIGYLVFEYVGAGRWYIFLCVVSVGYRSVIVGGIAKLECPAWIYSSFFSANQFSPTRRAKAKCYRLILSTQFYAFYIVCTVHTE
jgi:hypothetical protein